MHGYTILIVIIIIIIMRRRRRRLLLIIGRGRGGQRCILGGAPSRPGVDRIRRRSVLDRTLHIHNLVMIVEVTVARDEKHRTQHECADDPARHLLPSCSSLRLARSSRCLEVSKQMLQNLESKRQEERASLSCLVAFLD